MSEPKLWSIRHRTGWCAARYVRDPSGRDSVRCLCGYYVLFPWGCEPLWRKRVTCLDCLERLEPKRRKAKPDKHDPRDVAILGGEDLGGEGDDES